MLPDYERIRWWTPPALFVLVLLTGVLFGAVTNLVNALISPAYFRAAMGWWTLNVLPLAVSQAIVEGSVLGLLGGAAFAIAVAATTRLRCPLSVPCRALFYAVMILAALWAIGGVCGLIFAFDSTGNFPKHDDWSSPNHKRLAALRMGRRINLGRVRGCSVGYRLRMRQDVSLVA